MRVEHARPPVHPVNTLATGLVVVDVEIQQTGKIQTRVLRGEPPFVASALKALQGWQFVPAPLGAVKRTSVTFLFRAPFIYGAKVDSGFARPPDLVEEAPALPQQVIDPGYPPASLATGAAILEVHISASGQVVSSKTIDGVTPLTDKAQAAINRWRFAPARVSGKAAPSTTFVVISFVRPALA